jgi:hypothetical protein
MPMAAMLGFYLYPTAEGSGNFVINKNAPGAAAAK